MVPHSLEKMAYVPQRSAVPPAQFVMEDTAWREYYYPPFASIAKGEVFVFTFAVLFVFCQRFLDNPRANSRQILDAGVGLLWFRMCLLPFWGLAAPGGRKKGEMKFLLLWESMENFCILAVFERYLSNSCTDPHQILFV